MLDRITKNLDNVSLWILSLTVFLVPIFFLPLTILGLSQAKLSLFIFGTTLSLIFFIIERIRKGTAKLSIGLFGICSILIIITSFLASYFSINQYKSLIGQLSEFDTSIIVLTSFVFIFLIINLVDSYKKAINLLILFFSSIFVSIIYKVAEIFIGSKLSLGILFQKTDTLSGGWSDLTILSVIFLGAVVVFLETVNLKKWKFALLSTTLIFPFFYVALSGISFDLYLFNLSLSTILAISGVVLFAYVYSLKRSANNDVLSTDQDRFNPKIVPSVLFLGLAVLLTIFWVPINSFLIKGTNVYYIESRPNWQATYLISSNVLKDRLLLGSGPNTFDTEWSLNKTNDVNNNPFWNNDFNFGVGFIPTTVVTNGLIGFLLWLMFSVLMLVFSIKYLFNKKQNGPERVLQIVISFGVISTVLLSLFYSAGFVVWFAEIIFIGLLLAIKRSKLKLKELRFDKTQLSNFVSTLVFIVVIVASVYLMYIILLKNIANIYYRKSLSSKDLQNAIVSIENAISYDKSNPLYFISASQLYTAKLSEILYSQNKSQASSELINQNLNTALSFAVKAEEVSHNDFKSKINTGKLLEFFGNTGLEDAKKIAIQKYLEANIASPSNPLPYLFISNIFLGTGEKNAANDYLKKALQLKSDYSDVPELGNEIKVLLEKLNASSSKQQSATTTEKEKSDTKETKN